MTTADIAAALTTALDKAAAQAAGAPCALVSMSWELLAAPASGAVETRIERRTRTLVFANAAFVDAAGARIASASSVHRVID